MINKKRIIFILFLILFVMLFFSNVNYAFQTEIEYDGNKYISDIPEMYDEYEYYFLWQDGEGSRFYTLLLANSPFVFTYNDDTNTQGNITTSDGSSFLRTQGMWYSNSQTVIFKTTDGYPFTQTSHGLNPSLLPNYNVNHNVINTKDGSVFFQAPLEEGILATTLQETPLEEVTQEIMLILPLIIVAVVSLIGLRKAWRLLSKLLRKA